MKVLTHNRNPEKRIKDISAWNIDAKDKKDLLEFLEAYKRGEITGRIGTNIDATIERTLEYLKPIFIYINKTKPLYQIQKTDKEVMQKFLSALLQGKIKSSTNKPYSLKVQGLMLKTFINYIKWKLPEDHLPLTKILNVRIMKKLSEPDYLAPEEIEKLYKACSAAYQRYFIAVLFASGARAEEFHNIKYSDIEMPKGDEQFIHVRISNTTSKTKGRTIPLYWKYCLEAVREYLDERIKEGMKPDEPVFNVLYPTAKSWLKELGKRVLHKNVHYHLFRSSCATWMVDKIPARNDFYTFFGWAFSSPMGDVYINRRGITFKSAEATIAKTNIEDLSSKLEKVKYEKDLEIDALKNKLDKLSSVMLEIREEYNKTIQTIKEAKKTPLPANMILTKK